MFSEKKLTQIASYIIKKEGYEIEKLKLLNLIYLIERKHLIKYGESMSGDNFYSTFYVPVMYYAYNLVHNGGRIWNLSISRKGSLKLRLKHEILEEHIDELSLSEISIIDNILNKFQNFNSLNLSHYIKNNCKEWKKPIQNFTLINRADILSIEGFLKNI